jgi:GNAT superfamily N-acetyltransferase
MKEAFRQIHKGEPLFATMQSELERAELPTTDLFDEDARYFALGDRGFGGLVRLGDIVLLRPIVVPHGRRNRGTGKAVLDGLLTEAKSLGAREAWLLTTTAESFFARHAFVRAARGEAPAAIRDTSQFQSLCPESAALMRFRL